MTLKRLLQESDGVTRREFVSAAAKGLLGLTAMPLLSRVAAAQDAGVLPRRAATARNVIYLYMSGGMSHLDTFDLKPGSETQGPTEALTTNVDGVLVSQHFPNLAKRMDRVAVINSMFSNQGAHQQGRYLMHTSYQLRGTIKHPSMGAWLTRMQGKHNPTLPGHVAINGGADTATAGFLESEFGPLPIGDPAAGLQNGRLAKGVDEKTFDRRMERLREINETFAAKYDQKKVRAYDDMYEEAIRLMSSKDLAAFDISKEPQSLRDAYGDDPFAQGCLLARRLVEHQVRFVEVVYGGWDSHNENFETMEDRCPVLDQALSALLADLEARGMLEETLVVLATEFGRTPEIKAGRNGRDHHPKAFSCLLAGGGIRGGIRYGKTDERGDGVIEGKVTVPDFNATIAHALGLPLEEKVFSSSGRPFTVADKGKPVMALFA